MAPSESESAAGYGALTLRDRNMIGLAQIFYQEDTAFRHLADQALASISRDARTGTIHYPDAFKLRLSTGATLAQWLLHQHGDRLKRVNDWDPSRRSSS